MNSPSKHQPWADVAVFEDLDAARTVETSLINQGLQARTYDDKFFRAFLFLRPPEVTYRVQVHAEDLARTNEFLAKDPPAVLRDAIHCPSCNSLRVSYPQMTRKFVTPTIVLHLAILMRLLDHQCYCDKCHFMWALLRKTGHLSSEEIVKPSL